ARRAVPAADPDRAWHAVERGRRDRDAARRCPASRTGEPELPGRHGRTDHAAAVAAGGARRPAGTHDAGSGYGAGDAEPAGHREVTRRRGADPRVALHPYAVLAEPRPVTRGHLRHASRSALRP